MTRGLGVVMVLAAVGFAVVFGVTDEAIRRWWRRREARRTPAPYQQARHCRVVDPRQEINQ